MKPQIGCAILLGVATAVTALGQAAPYPFGPFRSQPGATAPRHAFSPFDSTSPSSPTTPPRPDFLPNRILLKLKPDALASSPQKMSGATMGIAGLGEIKRLFPTATVPFFRASSSGASSGASSVTPDLRLWVEAAVAPGANILALVQAARQSSLVAHAEPDYVYRLSDTVAASPPSTASDPNQPRRASAPIPTATTDPLFAQQWHLEAAAIPAAWSFLQTHGKEPGGSRDVVIAVIDSGVDLSHPDLVPNLWRNGAEIPGDGLDNDGNGIVDDVHGARFVGETTGNPSDDNGHGTHVSGLIAAAANNGVGGVGVAFNCQIMGLKASDSTGALGTSAIAKAIEYATAKGADVINMSFGGSSRAQVIEDALRVAATRSVLIAAAGNSARPNESPATRVQAFYPASYSFVLGVMAHKAAPSTNGDYLARFSNWDSVPGSRIEYEIMSPGAAILSTLPGGQYAAWDGTSMATPIVSGVAALVRSQYPDRTAYGGGYIAAQILTAATTLQGITPTGGTALSYKVLNGLQAIATSASPSLAYVEHYVFDTRAIATNNDADGIADAGETIDLAVVVRNSGGKGNPVSVKLEAIPSGSTTPDPFVTWVVDTVDYGAVGDFNEDDNGLLTTDGLPSGVAQPFRLTLSPNAPNDYVVPIKVTISATNGYNATDPHGPYVTTSYFNFLVQRGSTLQGVISDSRVLTKDRLWIIAAPTLVPNGVSITMEAGAQLKVDHLLQIEGAFQAHGTTASPIEIFGSGKIDTVANLGTSSYRFVRIDRTILAGATALLYRCELRDASLQPGTGMIPEITESKFYSVDPAPPWIGTNWNSVDRCLFQRVNTQGSSPFRGSLTDSVFLDMFPTVVEVRHLSNLKTNSFLSKFLNPNPQSWMNFSATGTTRGTVFDASNNFWGTATDAQIALSVIDFFDGNFEMGEIRTLPKLTAPAPTTWPHVANITLAAGTTTNPTSVGAEEVTFTVTFNRDMNPTRAPEVTFGPTLPATMYAVAPVGAGWQDARTWVGRFPVNRFTGDGYQYIRVAKAVAASDAWLVTGDDDGRFRFEVITAGVQSNLLTATGGVARVDLTWSQTDFELLAGYHLYRATAEAGPYTRLNSSIIPAATRQYQDLNVVPGQRYFYKFTVILTDMTESAPSAVVDAAPVDTITPVIGHAPPATAEPNLSLSLTATITDNVRVTGATLHFRSAGQTTYQTRNLVNVTGAQWSVALEGPLVVAPGIEYYLSASDGVNTTTFGRAEEPYLIAVVDRPVVTGVSPATGGIAGGNTVTIAGSNFKTGARVFFGAAEATNVVLISPNQLTARPAAGGPARVGVRVENTNGSSFTLVNAYTFLDSAPTLLLPAVAATGATVTVPINAANLSGLLSARVVLAFDPALLRFRSAVAGALTNGWTLEANAPSAGQARISLASATAATGSGVLAQVDFDVLAGPGQTAALTFTEALLNDGAIAAQLTAGSVTTVQAAGIAGRVAYWDNPARTVAGATLTLEGAGTKTATSAADGTYGFTGLINASYTLRPAKSNQVEAITAFDAALVLRHDVGLGVLAGHALAAADVNLSGGVSPQDATHILQHAAGLQTLALPTGGNPWLFAPATRTYAALPANQTGQDFAAILRGDVSGNWLQATGQGGPAAKAGIALVPDAANNRTLAYVLLQYAEAPIFGVDLVLSHAPAAVLQTVTAPGSIPAVNSNTPGQILAALVRVDGYLGNQILLVATFQGTADPQLQIQRLLLNEGRVPFEGGASAAAFDTDGDGTIDPYGPPVIKTQPVSRQVAAGGSATFSLVVSGNPAPAFQWRKNSAPLTGATGASFTVGAVQVADAAIYDVVVTNREGSVTSIPATLTLITSDPAPTITTPPAGQTVIAGQPVTLAVVATGTAPLSYQWRKDGIALAGATAASFALTAAQGSDGGAYSVVVSNAAGSVVSPAAVLVVNVPPGITTQPASQTVVVGQPVTFTVVATGTAPLAYQWRKDGVALPGATLASISLTGAQLADAGTYTVVISNLVAGLTSGPAILAVNSGTVPAVATHAVAGGYFAGGTVTINQSVAYTGALSELRTQVLLPAGWTFAADNGSAAQTRPATGAADLAEWVWTTVPPSPLAFSYTLYAPAGAAGAQTIASLVLPRQGGVQTQTLALPDPLPLPQRHLADTSRDGRIDLIELTRVIELYNARAGTVRTGRYRVQAGTEDGFAPDTVSTVNQALAVHHSADSNRNGQIALLELTRVIELYNYRVGTTRTGAYHAQPGTEDGFAPGP